MMRAISSTDPVVAPSHVEVDEHQALPSGHPLGGLFNRPEIASRGGISAPCQGGVRYVAYG